ncbi:unnamed protein product [Acidithrix sp. C25]|nr:unnamed protein product [Acidithrix sp. C25]
MLPVRSEEPVLGLTNGCRSGLFFGAHLFIDTFSQVVDALDRAL